MKILVQSVTPSETASHIIVRMPVHTVTVFERLQPGIQTVPIRTRARKKKGFFLANLLFFPRAASVGLLFVVAFGVTGLLMDRSWAVNDSLLIKEVVRKETLPTRAGQPIHYTVFVQHSSVTKDHYLVSIPTEAFDVTVKDVSAHSTKLSYVPDIIKTADRKFINLSAEPSLQSVIKGITEKFFVGTANAQEVDQEPVAQDQTQTPMADSPPSADGQSPVQTAAPDDAASIDTQTPVIQPSQDPPPSIQEVQPVPDNSTTPPDVQPPQDSPQSEASPVADIPPSADFIQIDYQVLPPVIPQPPTTAESPIPDPSNNEPAASSSIMGAPLFTEAEQSSVLVKPLFNDGTTNIAFYIPYGDPAEWVWQSETPAIGDLPFSDYWAPTPAVGEYTAVEYFNDNQQFSCSDLSLQDCIADPHFISKFHFQITNQNDE